MSSLISGKGTLINIFTDVYTKSRDVLQSQTMEESWAGISQDLKLLLEAEGPNMTKGDSLNKLRKHLDDSRSLWQFSQSATAKEILKASKPDSAGFQDRAALIKAMKHFYLVAKKGNQTVWVVDSPKKYGKWTYDEFQGLDKDGLSTQLEHNSEVFGSGNRKMMSESLQLSRKWSSQVELALSTADDKLTKKVKRWFHVDGATDEEVKATTAALLVGYKKIHAACNSSQVIFSDRPHLRAGGTYDNTYASVNAGDVMPVVYIYELFLETGRRTFFGNIPKLWLCALTVVHELSHKLANTNDIRYDYEGLKPGAGFTSAQALTNADSWAYFAADVVSALTDTTIENVLT